MRGRFYSVTGLYCSTQHVSPSIRNTSSILKCYKLYDGQKCKYFPFTMEQDKKIWRFQTRVSTDTFAYLTEMHQFPEIIYSIHSLHVK